jgi:hypothetical protein
LATKRSRNVMTTDWFTASPTPLGPPLAFMPMYDATMAAMSPKTSALRRPIHRSGSCASAVKLAR